MTEFALVDVATSTFALYEILIGWDLFSVWDKGLLSLSTMLVLFAIGRLGKVKSLHKF